MFKAERGITLVALVVTIIVLIILAAVTLSLVLGQNGLLNKASSAGKNYNAAQVEEGNQLNTLWNDVQANYINGLE